MNFSKPIVSDEKVLRVLMTDFSELTLQVQAFLILLFVVVCLFVLKLAVVVIVDSLDYMFADFEERQELRANRKWLPLFGGKK